MNKHTITELNKLYSQDELTELIRARRAEKDSEEAAIARDKQRKEAIEKIKEHLRQAEYHLRTAGDLGEKYTINFSFADPKNRTCTYLAGWQSSACYVSDGWYAAEEFDHLLAVSTVDGEPVEAIDHTHTCTMSVLWKTRSYLLP